MADGYAKELSVEDWGKDPRWGDVYDANSPFIDNGQGLNFDSSGAAIPEKPRPSLNTPPMPPAAMPVAYLSERDRQFDPLRKPGMQDRELDIARARKAALEYFQKTQKPKYQGAARVDDSAKLEKEEITIDLPASSTTTTPGKEEKRKPKTFTYDDSGKLLVTLANGKTIRGMPLNRNQLESAGFTEEGKKPSAKTVQGNKLEAKAKEIKQRHLDSVPLEWLSRSYEAGGSAPAKLMNGLLWLDLQLRLFLETQLTTLQQRKNLQEGGI